jgi:photosystem II stability/assembly factor-like uncharacterized protein
MQYLFTLALLIAFSAPAIADSASQLVNLVTDKDADIYAIDSSESGQFIVAVGEDASERTKKLQMMDEYHESVILVSIDGGTSWNRSSSGGDVIPFDSVIVLDEKSAITSGAMEGAGGVIMLTKNLGKEWKPVFEGGMIHGLARNSERSIWAAGYGLLHSTNGGKSWKEAEAPDGYYYAIHAVDEETLITAGDNGLLRSTDAGKSWKPVPLPVSGDTFYKIELAGSAIKMRSWGNITLISDDGGKSWRKP